LPSPRRPLAGAAALAAGLAFAPSAFAVNYVPAANGTTWGVHDVAAPALDTGSIRNVTGSDALIGFGGIRVRVAQSPEPRFNGELMRGFGLRFDGYERFKTTTAVDLGGIEISRALHVERSSTWARWVDTFTNTTASTQTVEVVFGGQTGFAPTGGAASNPSNSTVNQTEIAETSSGDRTLATNDRWALVHAPAESVRASSLRWAGPSGVAFGAIGRTANFLTGAFDNPLALAGHEANYQGYGNTLTLRPGETRSLVTFVAAGARTDAPAAELASVRGVVAGLAAAPELDDLSTGELCAIANWPLAGLGVPGFDPADCADAVPSQIPTSEAPAAAAPKTSSPYDVTGKSLTQLQADMASGATTSEQITRAYLDRIAAYDVGQFGFKSFITVARDAMDQARAADAARAAGKRSPVLGVPIAVKDLYDTKDMPTTNGSLVFEGFRPTRDAFQVAKLRDAGAVILGKANMAEYANSGYFSESGWGQVWNAFEPSKSSIGSSGGSATAVAASLAAVALGSQTGDSLWGPSSGASLYSLRGTDGMASGSGVMPLTWGQDYAGTIARSLPDLAAMLNVTTGTDPADEWTVEANADARRPADWSAALDASALRGKTIGFYADAFPAGFGMPGTRDAMVAAFDGFRRAGATVKEIAAPPSAPAQVAGSSKRGYEGWARWIEAHPESPYRTAEEIVASQKRLVYSRQRLPYAPPGRMTPTEVALWKQYRADYQERLARWMDDTGVDAVVFPGLLSDIALNDSVTPSFARVDPQSSAAGVPSVIFPAGRNDHGEPINLQLQGKAWDDAKLMGFAYAFDRVQQGHVETDQAPPLTYDPSYTPRPIVIEKPVPPVTVPGPETPRAPVARRQPIRVALASRATVRGGKVRFVLRNAAATRVTGTVTLRAKVGGKTVVLGSGRVSVAGRRRATLVVTLGRAARRALGRRARVTATATYALRNPSGARTTRRARLTIRLR
jgi:amidase